MCNDNNIINVNTIYSDKIATKYFEKLNSLSKGQKILQNYKESIQRSATSGTPLCYIFEKSEFKSKNFLSIKSSWKKNMFH